ncbi:MAG: YkvA family protein [Fusobacteriaceae bacterium]
MSDKNLPEISKLKKFNYEKFAKKFTESSFWDKLKKFAKKIGANLVYHALLLFYVFKKDGVPTKDKALIIGGLGYLISPIDLIPDFLLFGYTDDAGILIAIVKVMGKHIDANIKSQAVEKIREWFPKFQEEDLKF